MTTEPRKCAHQTCRCMVSEGKNFCGPWCEATKHSADGAVCDCSHPACHEKLSEEE